MHRASATVVAPVGDAQDAILLGRSDSLVSDRRQVPLKEVFRNRLGDDVVLPCGISERHNAVRFSTGERNVEQSRGLIFFCLIRATDRVEVPQAVLQRVVAFEYARQIPQSTIRLGVPRVEDRCLLHGDVSVPLVLVYRYTDNAKWPLETLLLV